MGKFIKNGRVVILLQGRFAGKKAVVVKNFDEGTKARGYGHCLVAGIEKHPLKVTKRMTQKKQEKRSRVKTFVKYVNYNHIMPTRYTLPSEIDTKTLLSDVQMDTPEGRKEAKTAFKKLLQDKFQKPTLDKAGKPARELVFLRNKLRF